MRDVASFKSTGDIEVLHLMNSEGVYGAEQVVLELLKVMQKRKEKVAFACFSPAGTPGAEIGSLMIAQNVPTFFIDERKRISFKGLARIREVLKSTGVQILHAHGYKATILGGFVAKLCGLPFVCTYHGETKHLPELKWYVRLENYFVRRAIKIIAVSDAIKYELIHRGVSRDKISVVYNGIGDPFCTGLPFEIKKQKVFDPHLLCVGRLVGLKRHDLVLQALRRIRQRYPYAGLSIAGEGPEKKNLKNLAEKLGLQSSVCFLGYVPDTKRLYEEADIFVLSSDAEGTPISLLEAMAASKPIVATGVGAVPNMVVHGLSALIVTPDNTESLTKAIETLLEDVDYAKRLGEYARQGFLEHFSSEKMVELYLSVYREIFNSQHRGKQ